ncbi:MAG: GNAT family N-acetyltransferase [Ruminococcus sp.]|nr:GNAT family N-acetyltransferase [Ruminococcus sp.]
MSGFTLKIAEGLENNPDAKLIRENVFVYEQGFEKEFDDIDPKAVHCVVYGGGFPVAAGRMFNCDGQAHIGRIAVVKAYRGKKIGSTVVSALEDYAKAHGYKETALSAQVRAKEFYQKLGYKEFGEEFFDEYCPHIMMKKIISE